MTPLPWVVRAKRRGSGEVVGTWRYHTERRARREAALMAERMTLDFEITKEADP